MAMDAVTWHCDSFVNATAHVVTLTDIDLSRDAQSSHHTYVGLGHISTDSPNDLCQISV